MTTRTGGTRFRDETVVFASGVSGRNVDVPSASPLNTYLVLAAIVGVVYYLLVWRTRFGFDLRATGSNAGAANASGVDGKRTFEIGLPDGPVDLGQEIPGGYHTETPARPGSSLVLTIDRDLQFEVQRMLSTFATGACGPSGGRFT